MPNNEKVRSTENNSTRLSSSATRNVEICYYKVSIHAQGVWTNTYKYGAYHSDIYLASSREEAIGMAILRVSRRYSGYTIEPRYISAQRLKF